MDNKTSEFADWDFDKLEAELEGLDFDGFDFGFDLGGDEFEETGLDSEEEKDSVIASINCGSVNCYEKIKDRLQTLCDEIGGSLAVKMA